MCNVPLYIKNEVYNLTRTRVGRYTCSMQIKFQEDCNEQKNMHAIEHRFITVFTRACHWPVSWDGWIQSKPLHTISHVNASALEYIKLYILFERWYHLDLCLNVCLYFNSIFLFWMLFIPGFQLQSVTSSCSVLSNCKNCPEQMCKSY
jgi:hypothetical protein